MLAEEYQQIRFTESTEKIHTVSMDAVEWMDEELNCTIVNKPM